MSLPLVSLGLESAFTIHALPEELLVAIFEQLSVPDLVSSTGVCWRWKRVCTVVWNTPFSGCIEAQFPRQHVIAEQFWQSIKARKSHHPESVGAYAKESVGGFLERRRQGCYETIASESFQAETARYRASAARYRATDGLRLAEDLEAAAVRREQAPLKKANGYALECKGGWSRIVLREVHKRIRLLEAAGIVEGLGCGIILKPEDYTPAIHEDVVQALYRSGEVKKDRQAFGTVEACVQCTFSDTSSGPESLSVITGGVLEKTVGWDTGRCDAYVSRLGCNAPSFLSFYMFTQLMQFERGFFPYGNVEVRVRDRFFYAPERRVSLLKESVLDERLCGQGAAAPPQSDRFFVYRRLRNSGIGAQKEFFVSHSFPPS